VRNYVAAVVFFVASTLALSGQTGKNEFFKTSDGIRIHYVESGSGRPIVFIPGWTMPAWIWQKQIDEFSKKYRVIAVDPRSQGESDKPPYGHLPETRARDYKELVDHLGLKKPVLVGWSMGCNELLKYAEQFGTDEVGGLVLVDGYLPDKLNPEFFAFMTAWMNLLQQDRQKQAEPFIRSMFKKPQPEDYLKRLTEASMQVPADTAVVLIYNMIAVKDYSGAFARINRPVLFAYQPESAPSAEVLKSKLGDRVRLERFDGDGHALFVDDPDKFNRLVDQFVQSLPQ
jgi:microsomal epoxide hydrolase